MNRSRSRGLGFVLVMSFFLFGFQRIQAQIVVKALGVTPQSGDVPTFNIPYGKGDIPWVAVVMNSELAAVRSCSVLYEPASSRFRLVNDAGTSWGTGATLGSDSTLSNSQCSLNVGASSASVTGSGLTLSLALRFSSAFSGPHSAYAVVPTTGTAPSGWAPLPSSAQSSALAAAASPINHVIFMMQENRTFDNYFGRLNPYKRANQWDFGDDGQKYEVDGLDGSRSDIANFNDEGIGFRPYKLATTCTDDMSSAWLESFGDVNRYDFSPTRAITMDGFVHTAESFAKSHGYFDTLGKRAMGYYDEQFLNYYYFMAAQFAVSDRWFSPVASKTVPNRIATMTGGTTQGLVRDPANDDQLGQLTIPTIFQALDGAAVSWKIYYIDTSPSGYPSTTFSLFSYSQNYLYGNPSHSGCAGSTQPSSVVGDSTNSFCIDPNHIAPISRYFADLQTNSLPAFAYIEPGYLDGSDEHPEYDIIPGQQKVAGIINALMNSSSWSSSVFFLSYDEGGGPFDHVPPVPGHTNDFTDPSLGITTDISSIAVNPDSYFPCPVVAGSYHCDLYNYGSFADPGYYPGDAAAQQGFAAQLGFRVPNIVISPFVRRHYVSHVPMDHTAVIKFVQARFIGAGAHLTARDAAQPDLLDFFDFNAIPWLSPPTPPAPSTASACDPTNLEQTLTLVRPPRPPRN